MLKGLTSQEVAEQKAKFGPNVISDRPKKPKLLKFLEQFNNFLIYLLLAAAAISFFIGDTLDAVLILSIVVINAFFGFYQEGKAEDALAVLKKMTTTRVRVFRDGAPEEVDSRDVVPGDILFLEEGSKIPADAQVLEAVNLEVNEASLTGESMPVVKAKDHPIFLGTVVARGRCHARVTAIGMGTEFGKIAESLAAVENEKTPLQKKLEGLTRVIGIIGIVAGIVVFGLSFAQGGTLLLAFILSISLAVAVVPEGLPVVMTLTLAIGVREMARRGAIVRRLASIEALGSVTLIATDKTGTLTENKMSVSKMLVSGREYSNGELASRVPTDEIFRILENGILCSTATLVPMHSDEKVNGSGSELGSSQKEVENGAHSPASTSADLPAGRQGQTSFQAHGLSPKFEVLGDPTEGAVLLLAASYGVDVEEARRGWEVVDEIPFDSKTRLMSVLVKKGMEGHAFAKGSPEAILNLCSHIELGRARPAMSEKHRKEVLTLIEQWASQGLRVLAFAYVPKPHESLGVLGEKKEYVFLGLMGLHDGPRPEVPAAIARALAAGVKVAMVTGDNEATARAIAAQCGIITAGEEAITGAQLQEYSDEELLKILPRVRIFARVKPEDKSRIVKLYQRLGEIVAVTGDGVNDVVALKQAEVGVAMGKIGTDVARDVADIVVTDDNFATIVDAVAQGRNIIKNMRNSIKYLLAGNLAEAAALIGGFFLGVPTLFIAIQILYINLISDSVPALALAFSPPEEGLMKNKPDRNLELIGKNDRSYILTAGGLGAALVLASYLWFARVAGAEVGRTAAFCVLAMMQSFIFLDLWLNRRAIIGNARLLLVPMFFVAFLLPFVLQAAILYTPALTAIFKITTVPQSTFLGFVAASALMLIPLVLMRPFLRHHNPDPNSNTQNQKKEYGGNPH